MVFDVSARADFYGPGSGYHLFVGFDSSVSLAKMKFDMDYRDPSKFHWSRDLNEDELNVLEEWVVKYEKTYKVIGYIKDDGKLKI